MEKCKPFYKNLNQIQSFSNQRYVTVQLLEQVCQNDEWLRQRVEKLNYLSPPAVRKGHLIKDFIDFARSYGCTSNDNNQIIFDNSLEDVKVLDFKENKHLIDVDQSSVNFVTLTPEYDSEGNLINNIEDQLDCCEILTKVHTREIPAENESFGTVTADKGVNSFWYFAWDKAKNYYVRPDWLKNWKDGEIPAVCRAQTFKAEASGTLESVDLKLAWNGSQSNDTGSPIYVQIWNTYRRFIKKTIWDNSKKKMVYDYIKYTSIPLKSNASSSQIKKGYYRENYSNQPKYEQYSKKLKYQDGNKKGEYKKDKNGVILTETNYRQKSTITDNDAYVIRMEYVQWLGHNKKKGQDSNGKTIYAPDIYHPLAEASYDLVGDSFPTIKFDKPCKVQEGQTYAIVLFSPLSEWKHCPRWGGWGRNCKRDEVYPDGHAFMSEDNGRTWIQYGKNGIDVDDKGKVLEYKKGKLTPQDFAFQCTVQTKQAGVDNETVYVNDECYLYSKPLYSHNISKVGIVPDVYGVDPENHTIEYEISTDGDYWMPIDSLTDVEISPTSNVLLFRARLKTNDPQTTPRIRNIRLNLTCKPASEMYVRSSFYEPRTDAMLGANVWGRIYAPFSMDDDVECSAEIIRGKEVTDHFIFKDVSEIIDLFNSYEWDTSDISNLDDLAIAQYLTVNYDILDDLKAKSVYVKPFILENSMYLLSLSPTYDSDDMIIIKDNDEDYFEDYELGGLSFTNNVAYPILKTRLQAPENVNSSDTNITTVGGESEDAFLEWKDYIFDYDKNLLIFKKETLDDLPGGDLYVTYNPIFLDNLSPEEIGVHNDSETGLPEEGLILDYFKETIKITNEYVQSRSVPLRVKPVDPIREVIINKDTENEKELFEGFDYDVDIENNCLVFKVNNIDGVSSILSKDDILQVVYTPNLDDNKLALAFYAKRNDASKQAVIEDCYFEYKV